MKDNTNSGSSETQDFKVKLEEAERMRDEYLNGWRRAQADLINFKKEEDRRLGEVAKYGLESILEELVIIMDNFDHGLKAIEKSGTKVDQGLHLIKNQLEELLRKRGVIKIEVKPGDQYNPMYHEAIQMVIAPEAAGMESGQISDMVEPGYMIHSKVLKPARVKVVQ